ncbi:hypothetical protein ACFQXA_15870 [Nocardiopsis composta]
MRPLIPAAPGCLLLVTARTRLPGLIAHAEHTDVDPLPDAEATELLGRLIHHTVDHLPAFAAAASGMPLALCAIAATLSLDPGHTPNLPHTAPLSPEDSVNNAINTAVDALPGPARRLYVLCGLHPGPHLTLPAAAALAGTEEDQTRQALHMTTAMSLTRPTGPGVWVLHDVVRAHARARIEEEIPEAERDGALDRLIDHYLVTAAAADIALNPERLRYASVFDRADPDLFGDSTAALAWWDAEGDTVAALVRLAHATGRHTPAWELADACKAWFVLRRPYRVWEEITDLALSAARATGHRPGEVGALLSKAQHAMCSQAFGEAEVLADQARIIAETDHPRSRSSALEVKARALSAAGRLEEALPVHQEATRLAEQHESRRGVALKKRFHGETLSRLGRHHEALLLLDPALEFFRQTADSYQVAQTLLGRIPALLGVGEVETAAHEAAEAAQIATLTESAIQAGAAAEALASVEAARGDHDAHRRHLKAALEHYRTLGAPEAERVQTRLRNLDQASRD